MLVWQDMDNNLASDNQDSFERCKSLAQGILQRSIKRLKQVISSLDDERIKFSAWEQVHQDALLLQSNLYRIKRGMEQISLSDWNTGAERILELNKQDQPHEQVAKRFKQARKMKGGLEHLGLKEEKLKIQLQKLEERLLALEVMHELAELKAFCKLHHIQLEPGKKEDPATRLPYEVYKTADGWELWAGRSAKDNDRLSFQYAKGSDWWFHVAGMSGSHIVVRARSGFEALPADVAQAAAQLAIHHSKARHQGSAEVVMTQCKHVRRYGKNQPGKVQVAHPQILHAHYQPELVKALKKQKD